MTTDIAEVTLRNLPAIIGTFLYWFTGINWLGVATFIWVVIQATRFIQKWFREETEYKKSRNRRKTDRKP